MNKPLVSIAFQTYDDKLDRQLKVYIDSLLRSEDVELDIVMSSARLTKPDLPSCVKIIEQNRDVPILKSLNEAVAGTNKESKYLAVCNDDMIMPKGTIRKLVDYIGENRLMISPMSSCMNHWLFSAAFNMGLPQKRFYDVSEMTPEIEQQIMDHPTGLNVGVPYPFIPNVFALATRKVYEEVGVFEEKFLQGWADTDYELRCQELKIPHYMHMGAMVFHYGGATAKTTANPEIRQKDIDTFEAKWGKDMARRFM